MTGREKGDPTPKRRAPDWRPLAALTAIVTGLAALGVLPLWPGLVHLVGLPPLGLTADLRVLLSGATGYGPFLIGLVVAILVRTTVLAAMLRSWDAWWFALRFQLLTLPIAAVSAATLFSAAATLFYLLFWVGAAICLTGVLLFGALPWTGRRTLRRAAGESVRHGFHVGTIGAYLAAVVVLGAIAEASGPVGQVLSVPGSAVLTYAAVWVMAAAPTWSWLVVGRRAVAGVAAAVVLTGVGIVLTGPAGPPEPADDVALREGSLLLMSGVDSSSGSGTIHRIDPRSLGYSCERTSYFSYAGAGDGQPGGEAPCPIRRGSPYGPEHTYRGTAELVGHFVDQVGELPAPVTVMTHSQGAWIVWEALAEHGPMGVRDLILVGPFADNAVGYPVDRRPRPGRVGTDVLAHVVEPVAERSGFSRFTHDSPLAVDLLSSPERSAAIWARPLPDEVRALAVHSTFDLPFQLDGHTIERVENACPLLVAHPNLPYAREAHDAMRAHLDGGALEGCAWWRTGMATAARGFTVPSNRTDPPGPRLSPAETSRASP